MKSKLSSLIKNFKNSHYEQIQRPFIIAEAGVNHECNIDVAKKLIEDAANAGANAIKFQTYKADTIASKNSPSYWDTSKEKIKSQHELFSKYDKFWKSEFEILKKVCEDFKIEFLSTPFDFESAKFLNDLMEVYKISSSDITNKPFIEYICSFNKPILISTGASNVDEITEAASWIGKFKIKFSIMHCILNYPTEIKNANLGMIRDLQNKFPKNLIGYSDHTLPSQMENIITATLLGAKIIEKHFTHDKTLPGNDHYHAMDRDDLYLLQKKLDLLFESLGSFEKESIKEEEISRTNARRSLYYNKNINKGSVLTKNDIIAKRPGIGIGPKELDSIIGKKLKKNAIEDELIDQKDLI